MTQSVEWQKQVCMLPCYPGKIISDFSIPPSIFLEMYERMRDWGWAWIACSSPPKHWIAESVADRLSTWTTEGKEIPFWQWFSPSAWQHRNMSSVIWLWTTDQEVLPLWSAAFKCGYNPNTRKKPKVCYEPRRHQHPSLSPYQALLWHKEQKEAGQHPSGRTDSSSQTDRKQAREERLLDVALADVELRVRAQKYCAAGDTRDACLTASSRTSTRTLVEWERRCCASFQQKEGWKCSQQTHKATDSMKGPYYAYFQSHVFN